MTRAGLVALLSHWRRRPMQFVTLVLGLALATGLWSAVQAINAEARSSYAEAAEAVGRDRTALVARDGAAIGDGEYVALRRAGWLASPVIEGQIMTEAGRLRLVGVDPLSAPPGLVPEGDGAGDGGPASTEGGGFSDFLRPPGQLLVAPATADRLAGTDLPPRVVVNGAAPGVAIGDIGIVQTLLERPGEIDRLVLSEDQPLGLPPLEEVAPNLERRVPETTADVGRLTDSFHLNLTAFGLLSFAVGLFIVHGAIGLAFEQRRPMIRTLRALGLSAPRLVALLAAELGLIALLAGALGIVMGYAVAAALIPDVAATLRGLYGASVEGALTLAPSWWLTGLAVALGGAVIAGGANLWQTARMPLLAPAQPRAWARASARAMRLQAGAAILILAVGFAAFFVRGGLQGGFAILGGTLLSAALVLPILLAGALAIGARRSSGVLSSWFWADTRQQLPGLSLALMALLLALATNIGVGTMVSSFRLTFTGWLDQRLASELYVQAEDDEEGLRQFLEDRARAVLPIFSTEGEILGRPTQIYGVADHPTYRDNWPLLSAEPGVWDAVARGDAILVNEQMSRAADLSPGDAIALPGGWRTRVAGVYSDYGNPMPQVLVGNDELVARYDDLDRGSFGVRIDPQRVDALTTALIEEYGLPPDNILDQAELKAVSLRIFEQTFAVTGALKVLTLAVAGLAILTSLLTLASMRLPQLAPVWALGLTRGRLARLELLRAVVLAALTYVAAVPLGIVLAWLLLAVINVEAFGWRLPLRLFPLDWLWLGGLAIVAAAAASAWPALRLARLPPGDLLKVFAHER